MTLQQGDGACRAKIFAYQDLGAFPASLRAYCVFAGDAKSLQRSPKRKKTPRIVC